MTCDSTEKIDNEKALALIRDVDLEGEEGRVVTAIVSEYSLQIITVTS
jgi:hypothetical protein